LGMGVDEQLKEAFYHTLKELEILNIIDSLRTGDFEEVRKAHDSVHEFLLLAPLSLPSLGKVTWQQKSAFLTYQWEAFHLAHRAFVEALAGYYNAGYTLLRNTLELLVRGAFWECLARKNFRACAKVLDEVKQRYGRGRKSIKDWIEELIKIKPSTEKELEKTSVSIFDKTAPILEDEEFRREYVRLPFSVIVRQLVEWKIIDIPEAYHVVYSDLYGRLSKDVHVFPDKTDIGRRLLGEKDFLKIVVVPTELNRFMKDLHKVIDIGIVIELNILSDWIRENEEVQTSLGKRLKILENLGLKFGSKKLRSLTNSSK